MDLESVFDKAQRIANDKLEQYCRGTGEEYKVLIPLNQKGPDIIIEVYNTTAGGTKDEAGHVDMSPPQNVVDYVLRRMPAWVGGKNGELTFKLHPGIKPTADAVKFHPPEVEVS